MTFNAEASYSHTHAYVVKLRRDCDAGTGHLVGRLEHVDSGRIRSFTSAEELIACLLRDLASIQNGSTESSS
jgi:hypothetical protein